MHPKRFFRLLFSSIASPASYVRVLNTPLSFSIRYLLVSYVFLAFVGTGFFAVFDVPTLDASLQRYVKELIAEYPEDLTLTWQDGQLQSSSPESLLVPFPDLPALSGLEGLPKYLLEVQPLVATLDDIEQYSQASALLIVGRSSIFAREVGGGWSEHALPADSLSDQEGPVALTKSRLVDQESEALSLSRFFIRMLILVFPFTFFFLSFPLRVLSVVLDSCILFLCARILGFALPFRKVFQLSIHIMAIAEIIALTTAVFTVELPMFSLAFWGYSIAVYWHIRHVRMLPITAVPDQDSK